MTTKTERYFAYALSIGCERPLETCQIVYQPDGGIMKQTYRYLIVPTPEIKAQLEKFWADEPW